MRIVSKIIFIILSLLLLPSFAIAQEIVIINPVEKTFNSNLVLFNLTASDSSLFYYLKDLGNSDRWIRICPKEDFKCTKFIRVKEGKNTFIIKAIDKEANIGIKNVTFNVDSKKPIIYRTFPLNGFITNGSMFYLQYSENNLKNIDLFYGYMDDIRELAIQNCTSGINKKCSFTVDLSEFHGKEIFFWFNVSDGVNTVSSKVNLIKVDVKVPIIKEFLVIPEQTKVKFIFEIQEENLHDIRYSEISSCGPAFTPVGLLCTKLDTNRCTVTKNFCSGSHNLTISVTDKAGNSNILNTSFEN